MNEKKYEIVDDVTGNVLATNMDLDMAFCFICGYSKIYCNIPLKLTIKEIVKTMDTNR